MKNQELSPEKSFEIINQIIGEAKTKFEENGFIYIMWGILVAIAAFSQFVLLTYEYYDINFIGWFLMPLGGFYSWYYYSKKVKGKQNLIGSIVSYTWVALGLNMMVLGFGFAPVLREHLVPVILILLSVGTVVSGVSLKSRLILFSGIIINISGFICFYLDWIFHSLLMGIVAIVAILIPGILLMRNHKKNKNV